MLRRARRWDQRQNLGSSRSAPTPPASIPMVLCTSRMSMVPSPGAGIGACTTGRQLVERALAKGKSANKGPMMGFSGALERRRQAGCGGLRSRSTMRFGVRGGARSHEGALRPLKPAGGVRHPARSELASPPPSQLCSFGRRPPSRPRVATPTRPFRVSDNNQSGAAQGGHQRRTARVIPRVPVVEPSGSDIRGIRVPPSGHGGDDRSMVEMSRVLLVALVASSLADIVWPRIALAVGVSPVVLAEATDSRSTSGP